MLAPNNGVKKGWINDAQNTQPIRQVISTFQKLDPVVTCRVYNLLIQRILLEIFRKMQYVTSKKASIHQSFFTMASTGTFNFERFKR